MRIIRMAPVFLLIAATAALAADDPATTAPSLPTIEIHIARQSLNEKTGLELIQLGLDLLKSANFNTVTNAQTLRQSVPKIQDHYRAALESDYVIIRYDHPAKIKTVAGEVAVYDIFIGLARPEYVSSLFTIDDQGRVVSHEKYSGELAVEFKKLASGGAN